MQKWWSGEEQEKGADWVNMKQKIGIGTEFN